MPLSNAFQFSLNDDIGVITSYIFIYFTLNTNPSSQAINRKKRKCLLKTSEDLFSF